MIPQRIWIAILTAWCSCLWAGVCFADLEGYSFHVQFENDFFGGGTDRHFTHGTRVECLTEPIPWITGLADKVPWFHSEKARKAPGEAIQGRASVSFGQNMYTPEDTFSRQLVQEDRPYAGWLYAGIGMVADQGSERYDKLELEVGIVGPASLAQDVQTFWHSLYGLHVPEGWDQQLHNEPGAVLYYEQARRFEKLNLGMGLKVDGIPHFGGALGNVYTYGAAGFTVRLGLDLENDFGPPRIRPSLPGSGFFRPREGLGWYFFAGPEVRLMVRNIFLDGNTFRDSHSVDKKPFVADLQAGLALQWSRFRLSYTQIFRSREFEGQDRGDLFGSLSLSYHF
ncbi:MAG: lipid A deacylase LpxR family protein [Thermodesulfobacteriota bacterium]